MNARYFTTQSVFVSLCQCREHTSLFLLISDGWLLICLWWWCCCCVCCGFFFLFVLAFIVILGLFFEVRKINRRASWFFLPLFALFASFGKPSSLVVESCGVVSVCVFVSFKVLENKNYSPTEIINLPASKSSRPLSTMNDSELSASELRQRYHRGGSAGVSS